MRHIAAVTLIGIILMVLSGPSRGVQPPALMAVEFINLAEPEYDFLEAKGKEKLSILLTKITDFSVVERRDTGEEGSFWYKPQGIDPSQAARIRNLTGAKYIALGTVQDVGHTAKHYQGYGLDTVNLVFKMQVSFKLYDTASGSVFYADEQDVKKIIRETPGLIIEEDDINDQLLSEALQKLIDRFEEGLEELHRPPITAGREVAISISSRPAGADIEIDGLFQGNTPARISLREGPHRIRLSLAGYLPWEKSLSAREGLEVNPQLEPLPPPPQSERKEE